MDCAMNVLLRDSEVDHVEDVLMCWAFDVMCQFTCLCVICLVHFAVIMCVVYWGRLLAILELLLARRFLLGSCEFL